MEIADRTGNCQILDRTAGLEPAMASRFDLTGEPQSAREVAGEATPKARI